MSPPQLSTSSSRNWEQEKASSIQPLVVGWDEPKPGKFKDFPPALHWNSELWTEHRTQCHASMISPLFVPQLLKLLRGRMTHMMTSFAYWIIFSPFQIQFFQFFCCICGLERWGFKWIGKHSSPAYLTHVIWKTNSPQLLSWFPGQAGESKQLIFPLVRALIHTHG